MQPYERVAQITNKPIGKIGNIMKMQLFVLKVLTNERVQTSLLGVIVLAMLILMFVMFVNATFPYDAELHAQAEIAEKYANVRVEYYENQKNSLNQ